MGDVLSLVRAYALSNPHATLTLRTPGGAPGRPWRWEATDPAWRKWLPNEPTSAHWYTPDQLGGLIAAYLTRDRQTGRVRTVRELVAEFAGLSGSAKQKAVAEATGLGRARLDELLDGDGGAIATEPVTRLLAAMQRESRAIKPEALGVLGKDHLARRLVEEYGVARDSVQYKKIAGVEAGRPFVLEVVFGVRDDRGGARAGRSVLAEINWTPALELPFKELPLLLGKQRADAHDPVVVVVHLARPGVQFTDRGKGNADV